MAWGITLGGERVSTDGALDVIRLVSVDANVKDVKNSHPNEYEAGTKRACWFCACLLKNVFRSTRRF